MSVTLASLLEPELIQNSHVNILTAKETAWTICIHISLFLFIYIYIYHYFYLYFYLYISLFLPHFNFRIFIFWRWPHSLDRLAFFVPTGFVKQLHYFFSLMRCDGMTRCHSDVRGLLTEAGRGVIYILPLVTVVELGSHFWIISQLHLAFTSG
jgi:hypothetical protein